MGKLDFIYKRQSVRSFKEDAVSDADIKEIIKAGVYAPSGRNLQNWHFVVVKNQAKINEMAEKVESKNAELAGMMAEDKAKALKAAAGYHTLFRKAPVVILVYAGPYPGVADDLAAAGIMPAAEIAELARVSPGIQNIAAAMENILLAAANLGYGTCWMTGPTYSGKEISKCIGFEKQGYYLAALTPLGVPAAGEYTNPPRKPLEEVLTIIE